MSGEIIFYLSILKTIKKIHPNLYVVMGGPHPTHDKTIVENKFIDAICTGEGEEAFSEFLELHPDENFYSVRNFSFVTDDGIVINNPLRPLIDINTLPIPDYDFFPRHSGDRIVTFASRNCVYRCTYCFNRDYADTYKEIGVKQIYSVMDVDKFIMTLKYLKDKYKGEFKYFFFSDDVFPIKRKWLSEFSERYRKEISMPFHVGINPVMIKESIIMLLKKAGCNRINFAIECGNERVRNEIMLRPKLTNEQMIELCSIVRRHGIYMFSQNIMMSPTETLEEAKQTVDLNIACRIDSASTSKFQPYPGTAMAKFAFENNLVKEGDILEMLPENYHHVSLIKFDKKDETAMNNLVKLFSFVVKFPVTKKLVYALIPYEILGDLFQRIDDQFWMTYTHRSSESITKNNLMIEFKLLMLFIKRLIFPLKKEKFIHYG
jgi:anaerobic magnesium-protoporphyrin IX monomethyl ester cyclase